MEYDEDEAKMKQLELELAMLKENSLRKRRNMEKHLESTPNVDHSVGNDRKKERKEVYEGNQHDQEVQIMSIDSKMRAVIRMVLTLVIFFFLFGLYEKYFFNPMFRNESQTELDYDTIASKLCPPETENCNYQLKKNWKSLLQNKVT